MNKGIIFGAGLLIGAAIGTTITVFAYQKEKKQWKEDLENARNSVREQADEKIEVTEKEMVEYYCQQLIDLGVPLKLEEIYYDKDDRVIQNRKTPLVNPLPEDLMPFEEEYDDCVPIEPNPEPYEIPSAEFGNKEFYDSETIIYYQGDHTMCDDNYELIDDWQHHVGDIEEKLDNVDASKRGEDVLYIRNELECSDYEILIYSDSYLHAIEGEDETLGDMAD